MIPKLSFHRSSKAFMRMSAKKYASSWHASKHQGMVNLAVHHTTGKIVLVGDHSVGKSALGYRLIHGRFKEQASTHGQQFWVFPALGKRRADGTDCEAILWDFAGQPDYRLVHALFVDNADLALVLFDASDLRDPLHGVGFWLKQLQTGQSRCPIILVAAQTDRGTCSLTPEELSAFCQRHGIVGPIATSACTGEGIGGAGRADEVPDPLGGQGRDGHDHDLQADQGLRPRPQGSGIGRPDHRHARGAPRPFGGHRCRLAFHRRRDADRRGPPGKLRLRETPADLEGRAAHPAPTGTAQQSGVVVRAGGAAESEGAGCAGGETAAGRRLRLSGAEGPARRRARRAPGLGGAAVPGAQRLFPRDRPAAHGAVSGLPRADQSEEAAGGGGRRPRMAWPIR